MLRNILKLGPAGSGSSDHSRQSSSARQLGEQKQSRPPSRTISAGVTTQQQQRKRGNGRGQGHLQQEDKEGRRQHVSHEMQGRDQCAQNQPNERPKVAPPACTSSQAGVEYQVDDMLAAERCVTQVTHERTRKASTEIEQNIKQPCPTERASSLLLRHSSSTGSSHAVDDAYNKLDQRDLKQRNDREQSATGAGESDSNAIPCKSPSRGKTLTSLAMASPAGEESLASEKVVSEVETAEHAKAASTTPLKSMSRGKTFAQLSTVAGAVGLSQENPKKPMESSTAPSAATLPLDGTIILSLKDPVYKLLIFECFQNLGPRVLGLDETRRRKEAVAKFLESMKAKGARKFCKIGRHGDPFQVSEDEAVNKLQCDFTRRNESKAQWHNRDLSAPDMFAPSKKRKRSKSKVVNQQTPHIDNSSLFIAQANSLGGRRKRKPPFNFAAEQAQTERIVNGLRDRDGAFSAQEHKAFETGCRSYCWGNWNDVQRLVSNRTAEDCEKHAAMVMQIDASVKDKLDKQYSDTWVSTNPDNALSPGVAANDLSSETPLSRSPAVGHAESPSRPTRKSAVAARSTIQQTISSERASSGDMGESLASPSTVDDTRLARTPDRKRPTRMRERDPFVDGFFMRLDSDERSSEKHYDEETAWRYHNPPFPLNSVEQLTSIRSAFAQQLAPSTTSDDLKPIPPPHDLPSFPDTGLCTWSFDEDSRVLLADFRDLSHQKGGHTEKPHMEDEMFLFRMMERDDITVVSQGLADAMDPTLLSREYFDGCIGNKYHHRIRQFESISTDGQANGGVSTKISKEKDGMLSMKFSDYFKYLDKRQAANVQDENAPPGEANTFTFVDGNDETKTVKVDEDALYLLDVDMVKLLPQSFDDLKNNFMLPSILPGGSHCMMNALNVNGRPFMGPNLYITPPASFTHFHQDGHGTVDSGHLCLSGYNEVVMLRRLTERHKYHALRLLTGASDSKKTLYDLPHRDQGGDEIRRDWPTAVSIEECKRMGYCPSVFVLKPGQLVHINKGRLHAFRKLAPSPLPPTDCHAVQRQILLDSKGDSKSEDICFSIAWDWMFKGVTSEGINREVSGIVECSALNQCHQLQSLAVPVTSLLFLAKENSSKVKPEPKNLFKMDFPTRAPLNVSEPDAKTVLRGILPSLEYIVRRHELAMETSTRSRDVKIERRPDTWRDPMHYSIDPYGNDYFCRGCGVELSNVYYHCLGCEQLLSKDFNICSNCHKAGRYKVFEQMHASKRRDEQFNHTGNDPHSKHGKFSLHYRFMDLIEERSLLEKCRSFVGSDLVARSEETKARLLSMSPEGETEINDVCSPTKKRKSNPNRRRYHPVDPQLELVNDGDRDYISDLYLFTMRQFRACNRSKPASINDGYPGFECIHYADGETPRQFFHSTCQNFSASISHMTNHLLQCASCPEGVVRTLKAYKASHSGQMKDLPKGSKNKFISIVWERLFKGAPVVENAEPHPNSEHTPTENSSSYPESVVADSDLAVGPGVGLALATTGDRAKPDEASQMASNLVGDESDERCRPNAEKEAKPKTSPTKGLPFVIKAAGDRVEEKILDSSAETLLLNKGQSHQKSSLSTIELECTENCAEEENLSNITGKPLNKEIEDNGIATAIATAVAPAPATPSKGSGTLTIIEAAPKSSIGRSDICISHDEIDECMELSKPESRDPERSVKCAQTGKIRKENLKSDMSQKDANKAEGEVTTSTVLDLDGIIAESTIDRTPPQIGCDLPETSKYGASDTVSAENKQDLTHDGLDILRDKDDISNAHEPAALAPDTVHGMFAKSQAPEPTLTKTHDLAFAPIAPALKDAETQLLGDTLDGASSKTEVNAHDSNAIHSDECGKTESHSQDWYAANKSALNQMSEFSHGRSTSNPRINTSAAKSASPVMAGGLSLLSIAAGSCSRLKEAPKPDEKAGIPNSSGNRKDEVPHERQHSDEKQSILEFSDKHENQAATTDQPGMDEGPAVKDNDTDNVSPFHSEPDRKRLRERKKANTNRRPTRTIAPADIDSEPEAKNKTGAEPNCPDGIDERSCTGTADIKDAVFICPTCDKAFRSMSSLKKHHGGAHRSKADESKVKVGLLDGNGAINKRFDSMEDLDRFCGLASRHLSAKFAAVPAVPDVASSSRKQRGRKRKQISNDTVAPPPPPAAASDSVKRRGRKRRQSSNETAKLPAAPDSKNKKERRRKSQSSGRSTRSDTASPDATKHVDGGSRPFKRSYRKQVRADTENESGEGMKYPINSRVIIWADNNYWGATIKGYKRKSNTVGYSVNYDGYAKSRRNWVKPELVAGLMNAEGKLVLDDEEGAA